MKPDAEYVRERNALTGKAMAIADTIAKELVRDPEIIRVAKETGFLVETTAWNRAYHAAMERLWRKREETWKSGT